MNVNPYESPGDTKPEPEDVRPAVTTPVESRAMVRIVRASSVVIGVGVGALLGMAFMAGIGPKMLRGNFALVDSLISIVLVGGTAGALITLAGISLLRTLDKAVLRRVNRRQTANEERSLRK